MAWTWIVTGLVAVFLVWLFVDSTYVVPRNCTRLLTTLADGRERSGRDLLAEARVGSSLYVCLRRLEDQGRVSSREESGSATAVRGHRPRRLYAITERGLARLRSTGSM